MRPARGLGAGIAVGLVVALALAGVTDDAPRPVPSAGEEGVLTLRLTAARGPFTVRGRAGGLFPGARGTLRVRIVNSRPFALTVTSVRVRVRRAGPGCPASTLVPSRYRGSFEVPPRTTRTLRLPIRMRRTATDACQGARYPLRLRARAVRR